MEEVIENLTSSLLESVSKNLPRESQRVIRNINVLFNDNLSEIEVDQIFVHLFDETSGVFRFVHIIIRKNDCKSYSNSLKDLFKLLYYLIKRFKTRIENYISSIYNLCWNLWHYDPPAAVKEETINVFTIIVECGPWTNDINYDEQFSNIFSIICRTKKITEKVKGRMYYLLGIISKLHPNSVRVHAKSFRSNILDNLKMLNIESKPSIYFTEGLLEAMTNHLINFACDPEVDKLFYSILYNCVKTFSKMTDSRNKIAYRAALNLITQHCHLFSTQMYEDYIHWHDRLNKWSFLYSDSRKSCILAVDAFYRSVAKTLQTRTTATDKQIFDYFFNIFKQKLGGRQTELRLAVRGFGLFAKPCKMHLNVEEVSRMLMKIIERITTLYLNENELTVEELENLPDYMRSFTEILTNLDEINDDHLDCLHQITVLMIKKIPLIHKSYHKVAIDSFLECVVMLSNYKEDVFQSFVSKTIYQSIIWTCSYRISIDAEIIKEQINTDSSIITYKSYLPFWKSTLDIVNYQEKQYEEFVLTMLLDELINTLFLLLNKLDLTTRKLHAEDFYYNSELNLEANNPKDFLIFVNIIDFYCDIFTTIQPKLLEKHVINLCEHTIKYSTKHIFVSGFYKLLTKILNVSNKLEYFNESSRKNHDSKSSCFTLISSHIKEIAFKVPQYKGDLQISLLNVILYAPVCFIPQIIPLLKPVLEVVFTIGRTYLNIAIQGIITLEDWYRNIPRNDIKPLIQFVLPFLDTILKCKTYINQDNNPVKRHANKNQKLKRVFIKEDPELPTLQQKILFFIGQIDSDNYNSLLNVENAIEYNIWQVKQNLKYEMPFNDIKPDISLDVLVPRILDVTLSSSDRKTKIAACELLHSIVIYILGTNSQIQLAAAGHFSKLFEKIFNPLLKLSCDEDQIIHQLFKPLVIQLMHYQSSQSQLRSFETQIVITTLIDTISHPTDAGLRDFSGRCLHEFVTWSIRQKGSSNLYNPLDNVRAIIKDINRLNVHPKPEKRLGAVLALNYIYDQLKTQKEIIDQYWLQLLYGLIMNLSLIDDTVNELFDITDQIEQAVNRVVDVIEKESRIFNKSSPNRHKPPGFNGNTLNDLVNWLFCQCSVHYMNCSHKCMEIFYKLAMKIDKVASPAKFIDTFIDREGFGTFLTVVENNLTEIPSFDETQNFNRIFVLIKWLNQLIITIDFYTWLLSRKMIAPDKLFRSENKIILAIDYFLKICFDFDSVITNFQQEVDELNRLKCYTIIRIFNFIISMIDHCNSYTFWTCLWDKKLQKLITLCLFEPYDIGFDLKNKEISENLPLKMKDLLESINKLSELYKSRLYICFREKLKDADVISDITEIVGKNDVPLNKSFYVDAVVILHRLNLIEYCQPNFISSDKIFETVFNVIIKTQGSDKYGIEIHSTVSTYLSKWVLLCLTSDTNKFIMNDLPLIVSYINKAGAIKNPQTRKLVSHWEYFYSIFKETILKRFLTNAPDVANEILINCIKTKNTSSMKVLIDLLNLVVDKKKKTEVKCNNLVEVILSHFKSLTELSGFTMKCSSPLLNLITPVVLVMDDPVGKFMNHKSGIDLWLLRVLTYEESNVHLYNVMPFKKKILSFLPCLTDKTNDHPLLDCYLDVFFQKYLNNQTIILTENSPEYIFFVSVLKKILEGFVKSGSLKLLTYVINLVVKEQRIAEDFLETYIERTMKKHSIDQQTKIINNIYCMCTEENKNPDEKMLISIKFLIPSLKHSHITSIEQFFTLRLKELLVILSETKLPENEDPNLQNILVSKIIAYSLIEVLYFSIDLNINEIQLSRILEATLVTSDDKSKDLLKTIVKCSINTRNETIESSDEKSNNLFRLYQCSSYKACVASMCNTKTDINNYLIHFQLKYWKKIIDCSKEYTFTQDVSELPLIRKHLISIRKKDKTERTINSTHRNVSIDYISTQTLFNSTLAEDVSKFDFSYSVLRNEDNKIPDDDNNISVELTENSVNENECMPTICGLLQHIASIYKSDGTTPLWIKEIQNVLLDSSSHKNIKLFLLQLIENNQEFFKNFSKELAPLIIQAITDYVCGEELNSFSINLIIMLLQWNDNYPMNEENTDTVSKLVEFIINNIKHEPRNMFKCHLELLKNIVEVWRNAISVPDTVLNNLCLRHTETAYIIVNINVSAIFSANKIKPWNDETENKFFDGLIMNLKNGLREVYSPCSELIGMVFNILDEEHSRKLSPCRQETFNLIKTHLLRLSKEPDRLCYCLEGIHKYYPPIIEAAFLNFLIRQFGVVNGRFQYILMKIFTSTLYKNYNSLKNYINLDFFKDSLQVDDLEVLQLSLQNVLNLLPYLNENLLDEVFNIIKNLSNHKDSQCRNILYDVMIWTYDKYRNTTNNYFSISRNILLDGLLDNDESLQIKIYEFWSKEINTSHNTLTYLVDILDKLYSDNNNSYYIGYCMYFLLESAINSYDANRKLFKYSLSNSKFEDYKIILDWRMQHLSLAPLFADSLANEIIRHGQTKSTQNYFLLATQTNREYSQYRPSTSRNIYEKSSLLFTMDNMNFNFSNTVNDIEQQNRTEYRVVLTQNQKLQFLNNQKQERIDYKLANIKKRNQNVEEPKHSKNKISLFRNYRIGDFPDIDISNAELLKPMQILVQRDPVFARYLFNTLFDGFVTKLNPDSSVEFLSNIGTQINKNLSNTSIYSANVVGTFLEISLKHKESIKLKPDVVVSASFETGLQPLACLLLEENIILGVDDEPEFKRAKKQLDLSKETDQWLKLVTLYKSISETDIVTGIFSEKIIYEDNEAILDALNYESAGLWKEAQHIYQTFVSKDISDDSYRNTIPEALLDFYYTAYFNTFEELSQWDVLYKNILESVLDKDLNNVWNSNWNRDKILPWILKSKLFNLLKDDKETNIYNYFQSWFNNPERKSYLKTHFSEELCMYSLLNDKIELSRTLIHLYKTLFLEDWLNLDPVCSKVRAKKLFNLKRISDIDIYLSLNEKVKVGDFNEYDNIHNWDQEFDQNLNLKLCDIQNQYRKLFLQKLSKKIQTDEESNVKINNILFNMDLHIIDKAFKCKNFSVLKKYLYEHHHNINNLEKSKQLIIQLQESKILYLKSTNEEDLNVSADILKKSWSRLENIISDNSLNSLYSLKILMHTHKYHIANDLIKVIEKDHSICAQIKDRFNLNDYSYENFSSYLKQQCFSSLRTCISVAEHKYTVQNAQEDSNSLANAYLNLANFCRAQNDNVNYGTHLVKSVLRSMKLGSDNARQIFPRLLLMPELESSLKDVFIQESNDIAEWMFIQWIPQLFANLNGPLLSILSELVLKITEAYPQAVINMFYLNKENYLSSNNNELNIFIERLSSRFMKNPDCNNYEYLIQAISAICLPESRLLYYIEKIRILLVTSDYNKSEILNYINKEIVLKNQCNFYGELHNFAEDYTNELQNLFNLDDPSSENVTNKLNNIVLELRESIKNRNDTILLLRKICPWLSEYQKTTKSSELEIPGQYKGTSKPLPKYHIKIDSFIQETTIIPSLRRPIKLLILGNDGKEYPYLVKFGEDLRQDQRIQQLFNLMNNIFNEDVACHQHNLLIETYQVIPLKHNIGIIQWLNETSAFNDFLNIDESLELKTYDMYNSWDVNKSVQNITDLYGNICKTYTREQIVAKYQKIVNLIPWDILRKSFWNISSSPEGYFALRQQFLTNYAVMCLVHWILGIGDRHCSNFLISMKTGRPVGIDFGLSFGTATQILNVPELVPFRLTPHIMNFLKPLDDCGFFNRIMYHCLNALKHNNDLLLASMEVFVQEPFIDWLEIAKSKTGKMESGEWYPRQKLNQCRNKLEGMHPVVVMEEDLAQNKSIVLYHDVYCDILKGDAQFNVRARLSKRFLKTEDQVKCLMDLATDYNVLGRMYSGWKPYV